MCTNLILIRHGQTEWNLFKRYCGDIDIGLNAKGKRQAKLLYKRLREEKFDSVYCSTKKRAIQTAKIIFPNYKINKIPTLREMHFGVLEGLTHKEILESYSEIYKKWLENPFYALIPYAEGLNSFKKRVVLAFKKIISKNNGKTTAVVCHGGTISIFLTYVFGNKAFWKYLVSSASISLLRIRGAKIRLIIFNDTQHLGETRKVSPFTRWEKLPL